MHARWLDQNGRELCKALAVAPEPHSFWNGSDAAARIAHIRVPDAMGRLEPADPRFNGPSGETLVARYLAPLGLDPSECWITDLHDTYYLSVGNEKALVKYNAIARQRGGPAACLPRRPNPVVPSAERFARLAEEFLAADAPLVITLGNEPLKPLLGASAGRLVADGYGRPLDAEVFGREVKVVRLCHPRQAGALGTSSRAWKDAHDAWVRSASRRKAS